MDRFLRSLFPYSGCKRATFHLACAWSIGLIAGVFLAGSAHSDNPQYTAMLLDGRNIAVQLLIILLPLLLSALAVFLGQPQLLVVIAFIKAFLFAYVGMDILLSCGSAGWLIRLLLMFADTLMLPVLWWYWLNIPDNRRFFLRTAAAALPALAVICLDSCIISPVLANLT